MDPSEGVGAARRRLEHAARGLVFISDIDAPFTWAHFPASRHDDLTPAGISSLAGLKGEPTVLELEEFLGGHMKPGPFAPVIHGSSARYRLLFETLRRELPGARVFVTGGPVRRCLLLGRLPDGTLGGLETHSRGP